MSAGTHPPSRVGEIEHRHDGSARCELHIPLGHPASRMFTVNRNVIEVENTRVYTAGPGTTVVQRIDSADNRRTPVEADLLPATRERPALVCRPTDLKNALRRGAPRFDQQAHTPETPLLDARR